MVQKPYQTHFSGKLDVSLTSGTLFSLIIDLQEGYLEQLLIAEAMSDANQKAASSWFTTAELLDYFQISRQILWSNRTRLCRGIHYRRANPYNPWSSLLWRLELMEEVLGQSVAAFQRKVMDNVIHDSSSWSDVLKGQK